MGWSCHLLHQEFGPLQQRATQAQGRAGETQGAWRACISDPGKSRGEQGVWGAGPGNGGGDQEAWGAGPGEG